MNERGRERVRALIVEDGQPAALLRMVLLPHGIEAVVVSSVPMLRAALADGRFDVLVIDLSTGAEREPCALPCVVWSGADDAHDRAAACGAVACVQKPNDPQDLAAAILHAARKDPDA